MSLLNVEDHVSNVRLPTYRVQDLDEDMAMHERGPIPS